MTKFESYGSKKQYGAMNIFAANKAFERSCSICGIKGKYVKCERCAIASAHYDMIHFVLKQERKWKSMMRKIVRSTIKVLTVASAFCTFCCLSTTLSVNGNAWFVIPTILFGALTLFCAWLIEDVHEDLC